MMPLKMRSVWFRRNCCISSRPLNIYAGGQFYGTVAKKLTLLRPKYTVDYKGWQVEGNMMGWEYDAFAGGVLVMHISKEIFHWGDTYVIDIADSADEIMALMLVLAIDAANCASN